MTGPFNTRRHPDVSPVHDAGGDARLDEGIRLFNEGHHWHAHEAWEPLWMALEGKDKLFLQGLIMAGAMLHQYKRGVARGVANHWENVLARLDPEGKWGIDAAGLLDQLRPYGEEGHAGHLGGGDPKRVQIERSGR